MSETYLSLSRFLLIFHAAALLEKTSSILHNIFERLILLTVLLMNYSTQLPTSFNCIKLMSILIIFDFNKQIDQVVNNTQIR